MSLANTYAKVIQEAEGKPNAKSFGDSLIAFMKAKGHMALLPQIVRILSRTPERETAVITVRDAEDAKKYKKEIDATLSELGVKGSHRISTDKRLVGGYSVRAEGKLVDKSFRSALVTLYQNSVR